MYMSMYTHNKIYNIYIYIYKINIIYVYIWHKCAYILQCKCPWKMSYEKVLNTLKLDKVIFYNCE